jgi:hypothetical protein
MKPPIKISTEYKLLESLPEAEETVQATDFFEIEGCPRVIVKAKMMPNAKMHFDFYNGEPLTGKIHRGSIWEEVIWLHGMSSINIVPELLLGLITLVIGITGIVFACISQQTIIALSMSGFVIAGATIMIGSKILKKRIESAS